MRLHLLSLKIDLVGHATELMSRVPASIWHADPSIRLVNTVDTSAPKTATSGMIMDKNRWVMRDDGDGRLNQSNHRKS